MGQDDSLAGRRGVTYRDLADRTLIMLGDDYPVQADLLARLAAVGVQPRRIIETAMPETMVPLAARERAVIVGTADASYGDEGSGVKVLPFEDASFSWDVYLITKAGSMPDVAATLFMSFAIDWARRRSEGVSSDGRLDEAVSPDETSSLG